MKRKVHAIAGFLSFSFIALFWSSTIISESFMERNIVAAVKIAISHALIVFVPCMAITAATGFAMEGKHPLPLLTAKRRRMSIIAMNGLLVLIPTALYLGFKARASAFDMEFYAIQSLELLAGATNLSLIGLNIRDGIRLGRQCHHV